MKKLVPIMSVAAALFLPASSAQAAGLPEVPEINCGIVSCTYQIEQKVEYVEKVAGQVVDCAGDTVTAYWHAINGYPQMYYCELG